MDIGRGNKGTVHSYGMKTTLQQVGFTISERLRHTECTTYHNLLHAVSPSYLSGGFCIIEVTVCDDKLIARVQVPTGDDDDTVKEGFVMFLSFAFFGAMPLLG